MELGRRLLAALGVAVCLLLAWSAGPRAQSLQDEMNAFVRLYQQGRYAEAEAPARRALDLAERQFGSNHQNTALMANNLAVLYTTQGRYAESEPLHKRALAILEKSKGPEHADVGQTLNNLAALYRTQGRLAEAEPLYKRALAIREKALGPGTRTSR